MASEDLVTMNSRGMITIPKYFRQKYNFREGMKFCIMEIDDVLTIVPIQNIEEMRNDLIPHEDLIKTFEEDRIQELELEK